MKGKGKDPILRTFLYGSGGYSPVNWLSQTRRNLAIEYLNLNFVTTLYLILYGKSFYFVRLAHSYFARAYHVQAFSIPIV